MFDQLLQKYPVLADFFTAADLYEEMQVPAKTILLKEGEVSKKAFNPPCSSTVYCFLFRDYPCSLKPYP